MWHQRDIQNLPIIHKNQIDMVNALTEVGIDYSRIIDCLILRLSKATLMNTPRARDNEKHSIYEIAKPTTTT
jgi:hypothetical protein